MSVYYQTEKEIQKVVEDFESCITGKDDFGHLRHLTVAVWYLQTSSVDEAFEKMRSGLLRFLDHHGIGLAPYSDQLTMSWITRVQTVVKEASRDVSIVEITNIVLQRLGTSRIIFEQDDAGGLKEVIQEDHQNFQSK